MNSNNFNQGVEKLRKLVGQVRAYLPFAAAQARQAYPDVVTRVEQGVETVRKIAYSVQEGVQTGVTEARETYKAIRDDDDQDETP